MRFAMDIEPAPDRSIDRPTDRPIDQVAGSWRRAFFVMLLLGATLGAALDGIHTHFGATRYANPIVLRMAWWVPLLFGGAFCIGLLRPLLDRRLSRAAPRPSLEKTVLAVALFVLAYFVTVVPLPWPVVSAILTAIFLFGWWRCDGSRVGFLIALGAAVGGPLFEMFLIVNGAFVHLHPVFFHLPGWLPFLYLCAAVGLTTLARYLVEKTAP
jgi:MFS family permease